MPKRKKPEIEEKAGDMEAESQTSTTKVNGINVRLKQRKVAKSSDADSQPSTEVKETAPPSEDKEEDDNVVVEEEVHPAVQYLQTFVNDRANWKFQKVRQIYLLKNIYNRSAISKHSFKLLLPYLEGIKGAQRGTIHSEAQGLVKDWEEQAEQKLVDPDVDKAAYRRFKRARKVLAVLS